MTIQEAFDALPATAWTEDQIIRVKYTGTSYAGGQVANAVCAASQGKRLWMEGVGGRVTVTSALDFNGTGTILTSNPIRVTVTISNFNFDRPGAQGDNAIETPGAGSLISNNYFRNWFRGIGLPWSGSNAGTTIERNYLTGCFYAIADGGAGSGGVEGSPFIIRSNMLENNSYAVFLDYPNYSYFVNNTLNYGGFITVRVSPTLTVANNLFTGYNNRQVFHFQWHTQADVAASAMSSNNNLFHQCGRMAYYSNSIFDMTLADFQANTGKDMNSIVADPLLVEQGTLTDYQPEDLQIQTGSGAVGLGMSGLPVGDIDFFGNARAQGTIDSGAHELN